VQAFFVYPPKRPPARPENRTGRRKDAWKEVTPRNQRKFSSADGTKKGRPGKPTPGAPF